MRIQRQRKPSHIPPLLKISIGVVVTVGVAFCVAWVWQNTELAAEENGPPPEPDPVSVLESESEPELEVALEPGPESAPEPEPLSSSPLPAESEPEQSGPEDASSESSAPENIAVFDGAVPESEPVSSSYFDDALFIGDSISTGIPLYHVADNAAVVAMTGIGPDNIITRKCIDIGGDERVTVLEAAATYGERGKVYIMLGGNSLGYDKQPFIEAYGAFLAEVKAQYPNAIIYLQSITPVVDGYINEIDPTIDNAKINGYNLEIMALAAREKVYYLDVASALKNENGALPIEASPHDGMHFSPEYYAKWFDYLKKHTVSSEESK